MPAFKLVKTRTDEVMPVSRKDLQHLLNAHDEWAVSLEAGEREAYLNHFKRLRDFVAKDPQIETRHYKLL